jgi:hypothetical protein
MGFTNSVFSNSAEIFIRVLDTANEGIEMIVLQTTETSNKVTFGKLNLKN